MALSNFTQAISFGQSKYQLRNENVQNLRISTWNISGAKHNTYFLRKLLNSCDLCCLQEHWLFPDNLEPFLNSVDINFKSWGRASSDLSYTSVSHRGKGGVAFLWRHNLDKNITILDEIGNDRIIALKLQLSKENILFIIAVYLPTSTESSTTFKLILDVLDEIICKFEQEGSVLLVGDFNAHIGNMGGPRSSTSMNRRGMNLYDCLGKYDLVSVNSQALCQGPIETFYANEGLVKTTVDHIFVQQENLPLVIDSAVVNDCSSNLSFHLPIVCTIKADLRQERREIKSVIKWGKLSNLQRENYGKEVENGLRNISSSYATLSGNINNVVDNLGDMLHLASKTIMNNEHKSHKKSYWNFNLTNLRKEVIYYRNIWLNEGKPRGRYYSSFSNFKEAKRRFRNAQRKAVYEDEIQNFEKFENLHDTDRSSFFRTISRTNNNKAPAGTVLEVDGKRVDDENDVLDIWQKHYEDLYTPSDLPSYDDEFKAFVEKSLQTYCLDSTQCKNDPLDNPFEFVEVQSVIQKLPNGKVGGVDDLTYEHLKYGGNCLTEFLVNIFNEIRVEECVPNKWTMGSIISILKSGKRNKLNKGNYRGITLLNVLGKVFERLFLDRWTPHFNSLGIPNQFQFAYQNEKSCVLSSFALQESIFYNLERGSKVHCCFLDSSKAFDTVWLDGLFYKLYNNGMKGKSWRILRDWYNRMACCVSVNGVNSYFFRARQGVRQGSVLSPWLYMIYNNDVPEILMATGEGVTVSDTKFSTIIVADDITLTSVKVSGLQKLIDAVENYSLKWRFEFNPVKTTVITFGESTQVNNVNKKLRQWTLKSVAINEKASWDHVGINLSGNFSSVDRTKKSAKKGKSVIGSLSKVGFYAAGLNPICGSNIWKSFALPAMLYGSELWNNLTTTETEILNRSSTFAAKRLQGMCMTTHSEAALGCLGLWSTMAYVDKTELLFFGNLCRANPNLLHKRVFTARLFSALWSETKKSWIYSRYYSYLEEIQPL